MIVDLVRNDLGRVCEWGSVEVPALLRGRGPSRAGPPGVDRDWSAAPRSRLGRRLEATFPPGSVTGAPKLAALAHRGARARPPRGVYCGAIGLGRRRPAQGDSTSRSGRSGSRAASCTSAPAVASHGTGPRRRVGRDRAQGSDLLRVASGSSRWREHRGVAERAPPGRRLGARSRLRPRADRGRRRLRDAQARRRPFARRATSSACTGQPPASSSAAVRDDDCAPPWRGC